MLELIDSSTREPAARQLRDEFEHLVNEDMLAYLAAAERRAALIGVDLVDLVKTRAAKRKAKAT